MSMLAERRKKVKWVLLPKKGPNKPIWDNEQKDSKFGQKLMEKMGWSVGKGLGANEQGIQEPLRVSYKNDTKGMGYKLNDDEWIEQQDEFNDLLSQLSGNKSTSENDFQKDEVKSLEEKSKKSKSRVHYQKFTRGKDLSLYSEKDLACILGTKKMNVENDIAFKKPKKNYETTKNSEEKTFGFKTTFGGSMVDYFANKQASLQKKKEESTFEFKSLNERNEMIDEIKDESYKEEFVAHELKPEKSKAKKRKFPSSSNFDSLNNYVENNINDDDNNSFNEVEKIKKRKKCFEENKTKHDSEILQNDKKLEGGKVEDITEMKEINESKKTSESDNDQITFRSANVEKNKKKKKFLEVTATNEQNSVSESVKITQSCDKPRNKEKQKTKTHDEKVTEDNDNNEYLEKSKKRKKEKEKKSQKPEIMEVEESLNEELKFCSFSSVDQKETEKVKTINQYIDIADNKNDLQLEVKKVKKKKKEKGEQVLKEKKKEKNNIEENNFDELVQLDDEYRKEKSKKKKRKKEAEIKESEFDFINNKDETQNSVLVTRQDIVSSFDLTEYKALKQKEKKVKKNKNENCEVDFSDSKEKSGCDEISKLKKKKKKLKMTESVEEENTGFFKVTEKSKKVKKSKKNEEKVEIDKTLEKSEKKELKEELSLAYKEVSSEKNNEMEQNNDEFIEQNIYHSHKLGIQKKNSYQTGNITNTKALKLYCGAEIDKFMGSNLASLGGYGKSLKRADICL